MLNIEFYGVRGSYPVPGESTIKYGGNTTCVTISTEVDNKIKRIIIDCGTGGIKLGKDILNNYYAKKEDIDEIIMLFTHLHPDHIQAFPFFAPNYLNNCVIHLMGMRTLKKQVGTVLEQTMMPPTFPIEYKDLKSDRRHYELKDGQIFHIGKKGIFMNGHLPPKEELVFKIEVMQAFAPSHPQQGSLYYKITEISSNQSVSCIWDLESHAGGDKAVINFTRNSDVLIHDTHYTSNEYQSNERIVQGFGHSTYEMAIENADQAEIKKLLLCTHFNPMHSDEKLDSIQNELTQLKHGKNSFYNIKLAQEGLKITL